MELRKALQCSPGGPEITGGPIMATVTRTVMRYHWRASTARRETACLALAVLPGWRSCTEMLPVTVEPESNLPVLEP